jgi:hypothetical protein
MQGKQPAAMSVGHRTSGAFHINQINTSLQVKNQKEAQEMFV